MAREFVVSANDIGQERCLFLEKFLGLLRGRAIPGWVRGPAAITPETGRSGETVFCRLSVCLVCPVSCLAGWGFGVNITYSEG
ncbi:hypothetical protein BO70DRAFT_361586 [Aspergillus heteromorphus CBS 117.55]|uniref:Uncharacterized protein n=1 Tax=Aspergillus heteromorphus CBS 117.55 TaxID=1448321 RepID=A0A317WAU1_9EURO|nr:uncharacterized protein BO70DRAFT_361586 [Aspergillus heteromorphus CBS 117.55]PWY83463.1 hypothetical protein BO70DRAFT_361586 [Aspergillus heteromorphus CBS 117.55]